MENLTELSDLPMRLLPWFDAHKRQLPWRKDKQPYHIWVSEIMLQQTRVEAVKGYYQRFVTALPTVESLAKADDEFLHKLWEGLGYYSRVRNMKKAAIMICEDFGGEFPTEHEQLLKLPGVGAYTAGAILSIAFEKPCPAVDGNVLRVYTRLTADATPIDDPAFKKVVSRSLADIYPVQAGDFTQALMELGATVCVPNGKPDCHLCPCSDLCLSFKNDKQLDFPVKAPKKQRKTEEKTVFILSCDGAYALEKRPDSGLLAGLWQFPNVPGKLTLEEALRALDGRGIVVRDVLRMVERKHIFTHVAWQMTGIYAEVAEKVGGYVWLTADEIRGAAAMPTAFRLFWEKIQ